MPDDLWPRVADAMHAGKMESRQGDNLSTAPRLSSFSFFENLSFLLVYHVILAMGASFYFYLLSFNFLLLVFISKLKCMFCFFKYSDLANIVSSVRSSSGYHGLIEIRNPLFQRVGLPMQSYVHWLK